MAVNVSKEWWVEFVLDTVMSHRIAGDLLGPVMENIGDLLRMPYGCGEQNMIYFAPNVFIILYFKRTNTYTPELAAKAQDYMLKGGWDTLLQTHIMYRLVPLSHKQERRLACHHWLQTEDILECNWKAWRRIPTTAGHDADKTFRGKR